jgi:squalene cyclase
MPLRNINIVAYYYPLLEDWNLLNKDAERYRRRIRSAMREEMIHAVQIMTVRQKYDQSP